MFDDIELTNCPEEFALNCKNYETKCHECKANSTGKYLKYTPIIKNNNVHPASITPKKQGATSYSRKGRTKEKKLIKQFKYILSNYASGMVAGDGDAHMDLANVGRVNVELKCRFTKKGKIYPTAKEYREAKNQNCPIIMIHHEPLNETRAYLTFKLFVNIWKEILFSNKVEVYQDDYEWGEAFSIYIINTKAHRLGVDVFIGEERNCPINIFSSIGRDRCIVYDKPAGRYVMVDEECFAELIDLYVYVTT